jgi:[calcium/calmodulin-dependent protein kinase] kinase
VVSRRGSRSHAHQQRQEEEEEDNDSDSDEGLTMARRKKKPAESSFSAGVLPSPSRDRDGQFAQMHHQTHSVERLIGSARRRDTNASVGSTETAKKVFVDSD